MRPEVGHLLALGPWVEGSPLGSRDRRVGWRLRARGGEIQAEGIDGRRFAGRLGTPNRPGRKHPLPVALLELPGARCPISGAVIQIRDWNPPTLLWQAEGAFEQALDAARRQNTRPFELRAAMSLSRLWQQQGKQQEARELLAPIYDWFTEGFDTVDLQAAKALLAVLTLP